MKNAWVKLLHWFAAVDSACVRSLTPNAQLIYGALGIAMLINFIIVTGVYSKIFIPNFGVSLGLALALVISSLLVLGLNRMVAMSNTSLSGSEFAKFAMKADKSDSGFKSASLICKSAGLFILRISIQVISCTVTTFLFLLSLADSDIKVANQKAHNNVNSELREEYKSNILQKFDSDVAAGFSSEDTLANRIIEQEERLRYLTEKRDELTTKLTEARYQQQVEGGGLDGRAWGEGPRFNFQKNIADEYQKNVAEHNLEIQQVKHEIARLEDKKRAIQDKRDQLYFDKKEALSGIEKQIKDDPRFLSKKSGIFNDVAMFYNLLMYSEERVGMWITAVLIFCFMLLLELAPTIAKICKPVNTYDIAKQRKEYEAAVFISVNSDVKIDSIRASASRDRNELRKQQSKNMAPLEISNFTHGLDSKFYPQYKKYNVRGNNSG